MSKMLPSPLPKKDLPAYIRWRRRSLKLSIREFAELLSKHAGFRVSPSYVSSIENRKQDPKDSMMGPIAQALGVTSEELSKYDNRIPYEALETLNKLQPAYGFAFRRLVQRIVDVPIPACVLSEWVER